MDKLPKISVNGQLYDTASAAFSIEDRSFRFGDGFFQTIAVHRGVPYQWEHHAQAIHQAASIARIAVPDMVKKWLRHYLRATGLREGSVRLTVSRGVGSKGYLPTSNKSMLLLEGMTHEKRTTMPHQKAYMTDIRRYPASVLPGHVKWNQGLTNTLALLEAQDAHCDTAIQLTHDGYICEAANGNIFWEKDGELYTPALSTNCVAGSTRAALIRAIEATVHEVVAPLRDMLLADAIYLTNSNIILAQIVDIQPQEIAFEPHDTPLYNILLEDRIAYAIHHQEEWQ
jgi:branched-subunit amino acid aminotransferase/4-amino-4-deoxychorismate lyase